MEKTTLKNGKMPVSAKNELDELSAYRENVLVEGSQLDVDPALRSWIENQGFTIRWVNAVKHKQAGGYNANGWKALRMKDVPESIRQSVGFSFGESPEGFLVRNDLILGIRTNEANAAHKQRLQERADNQAGKATLRKQANRLRETLGQDAKIDDSYDE